MNDIFELAHHVDARAAEPYLRASGWELVRQGDLGNRWRLRGETETRNLAVPLPELDEHDRVLMLAAVLQTLAETESRSPELVARDLRHADNDMLEFRIIASGVADGAIPLRSLPELSTGALDAVVAAGRSEISRRPHYASGALPAPVARFVEEAKLTGTEQGSVVLLVRAPVSPPPAQPVIEGVEEPAPFERRLLTRLVDGVRAARAAAHRDLAGDEDELFDDDIELGLSANLCDALAKLSGDTSGLDARLAVRVRWALSRPKDEPSTTVELEHGELGQLKEIATRLKEISPIPGALVRGPVIRLVRHPGEAVGTIEVQADLEGKAKLVRMAVDLSDYELAWTAQIRDAEIEAVGMLERAGKIRELTNISSLRVV